MTLDEQTGDGIEALVALLDADAREGGGLVTVVRAMRDERGIAKAPKVAGNEGARKRGVEEGLVAHLLECRGKVGDDKLVAIAEGRTPDAQQALGQHDLRDVRMMREGVRLDFDRAGLHRVLTRLVVEQMHEVLALGRVAIQAALAVDFENAACGDGKARIISGEAELGVSRDAIAQRLERRGHAQGLDARPGERVVADGHEPFVEGDLGELAAAEEGALADGAQVARGREALETRIGERVVLDRGDGVGKIDL